MRPILLEMHGFASFREQTSVDFTDADFFVLVGPTGSGKSTVIDAMTFALYGSVPRWGRKGMVSLALAPTVTRGTVKLVFEVQRHRYVVARELRRVGSQGSQVQQRAASLERLVDPEGLALPGDPTVPMAKDLAGVLEAVERLVGLSFEDFCQCVVLPQGKFADFLQARPADRDQILLRLLGAEHYKKMMEQANQRAAAAAQRAATIADTLASYADATPAAEQEARAREVALGQLATRVDTVLPRIREAQQELEAADERLRRLQQEQAALARVVVPDGTAALDARLAAGREALHHARAAEHATEEKDATARDALAAGPPRAPLELIRERRAERAREQARIPGLELSASRLAQAAQEAGSQVQLAEKALEGLRDRRDEASRTLSEATGQVSRLEAEHGKLASVRVPAEVAALDERHRAAARAAGTAAQAVDEAERAELAARTALASAVPEAPLAQVQRDLGELRGVRTEVVAGRAAAGTARAAQESAEAALSAARQARDEHQRGVEDARRAHVVAGLRPHLTLGEPCPVCEQTVGTLPAPVHAPELAAAQARLHSSERSMATATTTAQHATTAVARAEADLRATLSRQDGLLRALTGALRGPLSGAPLPAAHAVAASSAASAEATGVAEAADVAGVAGAAAVAEAAGAAGLAEAADVAGAAAIDDGLVARAADEAAALRRERMAAAQAAEEAARAVSAARDRNRSAQAAAIRAERDLASAQTALRAARDPLVELGAPQLPDASIADGWAALAQWATQQAAARATALGAARDAATAATTGHRAAAAEFGTAERALAGQRAQAGTASRDEQQAAALLNQVSERVAELGRLLRDAPDEADVTARLELLDRLESAASQAAAALLDARGRRTAAEQALTRLQPEEDAARSALSAARDRVVALGAPAVDVRGAGLGVDVRDGGRGDGQAREGLGGKGHGILAAWTELATWAADRAVERGRDILVASGEVGTARQAATELAGGLRADLASAGLDLATDALAARAAPVVASTLADARAATARIAERRREAAALDGRQRDARDEQNVARMLGDLLRANNFQRWLVTEAVEDLVATASATLSSLSSGQFDLAYEDGDFYVVDHADADSRRSARTLSGGETFQASLALALALSSQISALAAAGAARLDSLFLDEGFGTLDSETLDVVASTLETLAQGDRMVGVVTHVMALAERVPVRFRVARNARSSTITREGFAAESLEA